MRSLTIAALELAVRMVGSLLNEEDFEGEAEEERLLHQINVSINLYLNFMKHN